MEEFERIARLKARLDTALSSDVVLGIGDDAAVLAPSTAPTVLSVDTAVEHVHFRWSFGTPKQLTRRALVAALSDLAAMAATPRALLCGLILADDVDDTRFDAIVEGLRETSLECNVPIIGGNLSAGRDTSITTTVVGKAIGGPVTRAGARVGDGIYVTGPVGGRALGLHGLLTGQQDHLTYFVDRWLTPRARVDLNEPLAATATAAVDISDGLLQDLEHLCRASGVSARVAWERVPLDPGLTEAAPALGVSVEALALTGGEVYELLFTTSDEQAASGWATRIGEVVPLQESTVQVMSAGRPVTPDTGGFRHFRRVSQGPA